jgi:hypothetical protein
MQTEKSCCEASPLILGDHSLHRNESVAVEHIDAKGFPFLCKLLCKSFTPPNAKSPNSVDVPVESGATNLLAITHWHIMVNDNGLRDMLQHPPCAMKFADGIERHRKNAGFLGVLL